jgi:hypothetical protein
MFNFLSLSFSFGSSKDRDKKRIKKIKIYLRNLNLRILNFMKEVIIKSFLSLPLLFLASPQRAARTGTKIKKFFIL